MTENRLLSVLLIHSFSAFFETAYQAGLQTPLIVTFSLHGNVLNFQINSKRAKPKLFWKTKKNIFMKINIVLTYIAKF